MSRENMEEHINNAIIELQKRVEEQAKKKAEDAKRQEV